MTDFRAQLAAHALRTIEGPQYNQLRRAIRDGNEPELTAEKHYELLVKELERWGEFSKRTLPVFVRWCRSKRLDPLAPTGLLVAVFVGHNCHLLTGPALLQVWRAVAGLDEEAQAAQVQAWLQDPAPRQLALPSA